MKHDDVAKVRNGRLVLDEPTDLPEGCEVDLSVKDADALDRAKRDDFIARSAAAGERGDVRDAREVLERIRSK